MKEKATSGEPCSVFPTVLVGNEQRSDAILGALRKRKKRGGECSIMIMIKWTDQQREEIRPLMHIELSLLVMANFMFCRAWLTSEDPLIYVRTIMKHV